MAIGAFWLTPNKDLSSTGTGEVSRGTTLVRPAQGHLTKKTHRDDDGSTCQPHSVEYGSHIFGVLIILFALITVATPAQVTRAEAIASLGPFTLQLRGPSNANARTGLPPIPRSLGR
jgi:hypothetical protein